MCQRGYTNTSLSLWDLRSAPGRRHVWRVLYRVHVPIVEIPVTTRATELAFSPSDPAHLLSAGDATGVINLWDIASTAAPQAAAPPPDVPTVSASGRTGRSSTSSGSASKHAPAGGPAPPPAPIRVFSGHTTRVRSLSFSAMRPAVFASGSDDWSLRLWDVKQQQHAWAADLGANVCGVAFSPWDEHIVACGTAAHSISIYDVRNNKTPLSTVQGAIIRGRPPLSLACRDSWINSRVSLWTVFVCIGP